MDLGIGGRRAAVAAASGGLGFASALALAEEGATVAICGRDRARLADAAARIDSAVGRACCTPIVADVSDAAGAAGFVTAASEAFDGLDILVTNAGGPPPGNFASTDVDAFPAALSMNLLSVVAMCKAAIPAMQAQRWGRVVAITSLAVRQPMANLILSNTARTGATAFLKTVAREVAVDGGDGQLGAARHPRHGADDRPLRRRPGGGDGRHPRGRDRRSGRLREDRRLPVQRAGTSSSPVPPSTSTAGRTPRSCEGRSPSLRSSDERQQFVVELGDSARGQRVVDDAHRRRIAGRARVGLGLGPHQGRGQIVVVVEVDPGAPDQRRRRDATTPGRRSADRRHRGCRGGDGRASLRMHRPTPRLGARPTRFLAARCRRSRRRCGSPARPPRARPSMATLPPDDWWRQASRDRPSERPGAEVQHAVDQAPPTRPVDDRQRLALVGETDAHAGQARRQQGAPPQGVDRGSSHR